MHSLDDMKIIDRYDKSDMLDLIESFPSQCRMAKEIGLQVRLPVSFKKYSNVVCTGLGGSAIGADVARSFLADEADRPIFVNRHYTLPEFVCKDTLVIASSYSGNTEETLSAYRDAKRRGAKIIVITSGGQLEGLADKDGFPVIIIPKGLPPRCALGYSFFPLLYTFSKIGLMKDKTKDIDEAIANMECLRDDQMGFEVPEKGNPAKRIAGKIFEKLPFIYAGQDHIDVVATRWRGQLAENAKTLASSHVFPEMNHNEIMGWENPKGLLKSFVIIMLRDKEDNDRVAKRMNVTAHLLKKESAGIIELRSSGKGRLSRIFSLIYTGDFVSFYLAMLNGRDPTPVEKITYLKGELAKL